MERTRQDQERVFLDEIIRYLGTKKYKSCKKTIDICLNRMYIKLNVSKENVINEKTILYGTRAL